jgi:hypothetical protein
MMKTVRSLAGVVISSIRSEIPKEYNALQQFVLKSHRKKVTAET